MKIRQCHFNERLLSVCPQSVCLSLNNCSIDVTLGEDITAPQTYRPSFYFSVEQNHQKQTHTGRWCFKVTHMRKKYFSEETSTFHFPLTTELLLFIIVNFSVSNLHFISLSLLKTVILTLLSLNEERAHEEQLHPWCRVVSCLKGKGSTTCLMTTKGRWQRRNQNKREPAVTTAANIWPQFYTDICMMKGLLWDLCF